MSETPIAYYAFGFVVTCEPDDPGIREDFFDEVIEVLRRECPDVGVRLLSREFTVPRMIVHRQIIEMPAGSAYVGSLHPTEEDEVALVVARSVIGERFGWARPPGRIDTIVACSDWKLETEDEEKTQ